MLTGDKITLSNMLEGGVEEMFQEEIKRIIENIDDPNTSATAKRKIQINIEVSPVANRKAATFTVEINSKLVGREKQIGTMFIEGETAVNFDSKQGEIEFLDNVKELKQV